MVLIGVVLPILLALMLSLRRLGYGICPTLILFWTWTFFISALRRIPTGDSSWCAHDLDGLLVLRRSDSPQTVDVLCRAWRTGAVVGKRKRICERRYL